MLAAAKQGGAVRGIERGVLLKTVRQIGIGQEKRTIGDQAGNAFLQLGFAAFTSVSRACHKCMWNEFAEYLDLIALRIMRQQREHGAAFHQFHKSKIKLVQLVD